MPPDGRHERYQTLVDQCAWSVNLSARLRTLSAGLDLDSRDWQYAPAAQRELAQHVCELFTLPAAERARCRWQLLQELEGPREAWFELEATDSRKFAAQGIQENYPDLAGLDPVFIDELAWGNTKRQRDKAPLPKVVTNPPRPAKSAPSSGRSNWPGWVTALMIVGAVSGYIQRAVSPPPLQITAGSEFSATD